MDAPSWIFPSSFTAGACWGCGRCASSAGPVLRELPRAAGFRARGWHQGPAGLWKWSSAGDLGSWQEHGDPWQQWGVDVQRAWARGCVSSHPAPRKARCAGKGPRCAGKGPRNPQRPQPEQGEGLPPTASSGGGNSCSFSILLNILKNKFWN